MGGDDGKQKEAFMLWDVMVCGILLIGLTVMIDMARGYRRRPSDWDGGE